MSFRKRTVARIGAGAVGLLAAGAFAAPAFASTATDLELTVAGTKLASGSDWKVGFAKIANKGEGTPTALKVTADLSALDLDKMAAVPDGEDCDLDGLKIVCVVPEADIPGPGETLDYPVVVFRTGPTASGPYTGKVTFSISSPDDTTPDNNKQTVEVAMSDQSGVDLGVEVPDVKDKLAEPGDKPGTPLNPGDTTVVLGWVYNWGDMIAKGVKVTVQLPEHVTFTETEDECEYSEDNRKAVCAYETVELLPTSESDKNEFVAGFWWPIKVSEDAPKHVTLRDGSWTVEALAQAPGRQLQAMAPSKLPKNVKMASAQDLGVTEVDASDNVDNFSVVLAKADGGTGGNLPVTGAEAGLIGGVGLAVVVVGGVMFLMARRRKVVLVTPEDEKPTA
ncbi:MAG TPA: cell wall anchor protein [Micromonosporaceae bacterium]|nr:cell wall anchor protein [Micromonosporaceae bacterium]